jgi:hypothetical protein
MLFCHYPHAHAETEKHFSDATIPVSEYPAAFWTKTSEIALGKNLPHKPLPAWAGCLSLGFAV